MFGVWTVSALAIGYVGLLFAIARFAESRGARFRSGAWEPLVYALSLAVYCTSWTFYGSVGHAAWSGFGFSLTYIGPLLTIVAGYPVLRKIIRTAKANNVTSIADFIGARYGKSQSVAALVTVVAVVGLVPYLALQLQAVSITFDVLVSQAPRSGPPVSAEPFWRDNAFHIALSMALFAILFGLRHVHSNERHPGMMAAVAFESVVKLCAFLALGLFSAFILFSEPAQLVERVSSLSELTARVTAVNLRPHWFAIAFLAALAFICLPRQFHVAVVENSNPANLRVAAWVFPLYLIALAVFVPWIATAGLFSFPRGTLPELYPLLLPMTNDQPVLTLAVFIGGLSAATAMIIVEVVALSTMICNEIVMPLLLRRTSFREYSGGDVSRLLLRTRWISAAFLMIAAYFYHSLTLRSYSLASIGLISFVAVAQFAPALILGLYWRRAHRHGAIAGIVGGCAIWTYAMLIPSLPGAETAPGTPRSEGLLPLLHPALDPFSTTVIWSLLVNVALLVTVSAIARRKERDSLQAEAFVAGTGTVPVDPSRAASIQRAATFDELKRLAERLVGAERASQAFSGSTQTLSDKDLASYTERLLSGAIGAASAHIMVAAALRGHRSRIGAARSILAEASEAILYNHDLLRATLENVPQGIGMFDTQGRLAAWNQRYLEMMGLSDAQAQTSAPLDAVLAAAGTPVNERTRQKHLPDGQVLELQLNPIQAGGFVLVCTDISEQMRAIEAIKHSERRVREANELLEHRVRERTRELTELNEELAEAKQSADAANVGKTRFFAAASHDLLQPLHVARILTGALSERHGTGKSNTLLKQLDRALGSVDELLQTLLDISKLDTGAVTPRLQPVELHKLLTAVAASFQPLAAQRGLLLRVRPSHAVVLTDPTLLRRILQNFLSNALRYTRKGKVLLGCRRRGDNIVLEVWDTGVGIPENQLQVIFEEFRRGGNNDPETPPGLGLGLAIVDRIARMLEHPVAVRSWPQKGSVFSLRVPLSAEAPVAQLPGVDDSPRGTLSRKLVLCVDNDPAVLIAMRTLLQGWSCEVLSAPHAEGAWAEIQKRGKLPDIVLMDYHLEGDVTGLAALEQLTSKAGRPLPAILITANYTDAVRNEAGVLGYPVLNKPVRPGALRALVAQMLSRDSPGRARSALSAS